MQTQEYSLTGEKKKKYFKLPIEKFLDKIPNPNPVEGAPKVGVEFNVSQWAMVHGLENNRFWVHISARRTGKSLGAAIIALAKLAEPNQKVIVIAPNYSLSSIIWDYVTKMIMKLEWPTPRYNTKDHVVELVNGSVFRLLSAQNRESLVGRDADLVIIDEAAIIPRDDYFQREVRPILSTNPNSRCLFITTPRGKEHYIYKYFMRNDDPEFPDWGSALFTWRANPYLSEKDILLAEKELAPSTFAQEYYCDWAISEGLIYNITDDNIADLSHIQPEDDRYTFIGGLDVGFRDWTAFCIIAERDGTYYLVDEFMCREKPTSFIAECIQEKERHWGIEQLYIDSANQQMRNDFSYEYDLYFSNAVKSVNEGIKYIQALVANKRVIINASCKGALRALRGYNWKETNGLVKPNHDEFSHMSDAVRYAIYTFSKSQVSIYTGS